MSQTFTINNSDPAQRAIVLRALNGYTGPIEVTIKRKLKIRSREANAYYFGVLVKAFREYNLEQGERWSADLCHEFLKQKFLREPIYSQVTGEVKGYITRSTTELDTKEFADYCQHIETFLSDLGIRLPASNVRGEVAA